MSDLAKGLFSSTVCSDAEAATNPLASLATELLLGPQQPTVFHAPGTSLEDEWEHAEALAHFEQVYADDTRHLDAAWQESQEAAWQESRELTQQEGLEAAWHEAAPTEEQRMQEEMELAWTEAGVQVSQEIWRELMKKQSTTEYSFSPSNQYLAHEAPLQLARDLDQRGLVPEAIAALEAEVTRNPMSSEAWQRLGELQAECDNDAQALAALQSGLAVDPFNLDSLLALGVSSLNEVQPEAVVRFLGMWLERNPDYSDLCTGITVAPGVERVVAALEAVCEMQPRDVKAATALGVLYVHQKRFEEAERVFSDAVRIEPSNYTLWNKLAAALYLQGKDAIPAYERVLDLRPTYIRAWANLASCYWRQGALHIAARFLLCALALNPADKHLWGKLTTMFLLMERLDLVKKIECQDPYCFSDEFDVIRRESLSV